MSDSIPFSQAVRYASISDIGMRRKNNQDSKNILVSSDEEFWRKRGHLFVVADGMGAHAAGELASKLAADNIPHLFSKDLDNDPITSLHQAVKGANATIYQRGCDEPEFNGMGTTCSSLLLLPMGAVIAHVGDSRVYRLRCGQLEQLTFDHSLVWEMQAAGKISGTATDLHLPKNIITRSLGPAPQVQIDLEGPFPVQKGDIYLLCSDGLSGQISDHEIGTIIGCLPPAESAQILVDLANLRGGPDNITVIVVQVDHAPVAKVRVALDEERRLPFWNTIFFLLFVLIAFICIFQNLIPVALVAGIGAVVTAIVTLLQYFDKTPKDRETVNDPKPLGRAPYRTYSCTPSDETVNSFAAISSELRNSAGKLNVEVDWDTFEQLVKSAADFAEKQLFSEAVRMHCKAISHIVASLKSDRESLRASDSHIDLI
ncbi:MAG: PP2C family serine/threonine-protein phosphatase [Planctomycetota bacterium]|nr:PP2C family serine/threonine-protein phosphatase [Planctomycetota bacterium]